MYTPFEYFVIVHNPMYIMSIEVHIYEEVGAAGKICRVKMSSQHFGILCALVSHEISLVLKH